MKITTRGSPTQGSETQGVQPLIICKLISLLYIINLFQHIYYIWSKLHFQSIKDPLNIHIYAVRVNFRQWMFIVRQRYKEVMQFSKHIYIKSNNQISVYFKKKKKRKKERKKERNLYLHFHIIERIINKHISWGMSAYRGKKINIYFLIIKHL